MVFTYQGESGRLCRNTPESNKDDLDFMCFIVKLDKGNYKYASNRLKSDPKFISKLINQDFTIYSTLKKDNVTLNTLLDDEDIMTQLIKEYYGAYCAISDRLMKSKSFAMKALNINNRVIYIMCSKHKNDPVVMKVALQQDSYNFTVMSARLQKMGYYAIMNYQDGIDINFKYFEDLNIIYFHAPL